MMVHRETEADFSPNSLSLDFAVRNDVGVGTYVTVTKPE